MPIRSTVFLHPSYKLAKQKVIERMGISDMNKMRMNSIRALLLLTALIVSSISFADDLRPRSVVRTGVVEVPEGMHLIVDRAGNRWLLPIGMDTPPERELKVTYYEAQQEPAVIGSIGKHKILDGPLSSLDAVVSEDRSDAENMMKRLPKPFVEMIAFEKEKNPHAQTSVDLQSLGVFSPDKFTTFKIPYIPMPASEMEFAHVSDYASPEIKRLIRTRKAGEEIVRFFIHPHSVKSYLPLIEKFGIVYHYEAISSSSPRSLIVMDPTDSKKKVFWIKPSLHKKLDGSVRINTDKKARRAIVMSEAIQNVDAKSMKKYGINFMLEPASLQPKGMLSSTIFRELQPGLLKPPAKTKYVPAIVLRNSGDEAVPELSMEEIIRLSGLNSKEALDVHIITPLLQKYFRMAFLEGLPGELHVQNFYYEVKKSKDGWLPSGNVIFKDNDGFRFDTELALRRGRGLEAFSRFDKPFTWGKFSNAIGRGMEKVPFVGSWYYKLIRNVNGFETLAGYLLHVMKSIDRRGRWNKDNMQRLFDDIAARELEKITGIKLDESDYGFGFNKGVNKVLNEWRTQLSRAVDETQRWDKQLQRTLSKEWDRLSGQGRVSVLRRSLTRDTFFVLHVTPDGAKVIEARTPKVSERLPDPTIGFAIVESKTQGGLVGEAAHARLDLKLRKFEKNKFQFLPLEKINRCLSAM